MRREDSPARPIPGLAVTALLPPAAVLSGVAGAVGVRPPGWLAGTVFAVGTWALLARGLRHSGARSLGPANAVTLARAWLTAGVVALAADAVAQSAPGASRAAAVLALVALPLDAVDGRVARRTGAASPLGARFDMEVDAALILALSVVLAAPLGAWVLAAGLLRYAFAAAGGLLPWLRAPLPARLSRKAVAAAQGVVLALAAAEVLPRPVAVAAVALALAALVWSFGRDVAWLAARPNAVRNRSRKASILQTGAVLPGRMPSAQRQPSIGCSTAGSRATTVTGTSRLAPGPVTTGAGWWSPRSTRTRSSVP
jgi:phosphatidylglycerophosphate synthase